MPGGHIVLNNDFGDGAYDAGGTSDEDDNALYEYACPTNNNSELNGRYTRPTGPPGPPVPFRSVPSNTITVEPVRLWPLWAAIAATAIIAIAALAQSVAEPPMVEPPPPTDRVQAPTPELPQPTASSLSTASAASTAVPLPPPGTCYCTSTTITFAAADPGPCYVVADGGNGTPNLLQDGGLYIRPGPPAVAGVVLEQATAVNGLAVNLSAQLTSNMPDIYGKNCTGTVGDVLLVDKIMRYARGQGYNCSREFSSKAELEGDAETRPPSMYLVPYMCR